MQPDKRCCGCGEVKPLTEFHNKRNRKTQAYCKSCVSIRGRIRLYGISKEEIQALHERAADKCEICGAETKLHIDHDHESGEVRGLLCVSCNTVLGKIEKPGFLRAVQTYLRRTRRGYAA